MMNAQLPIRILRWREHEDAIRHGKLAVAAKYGTPLGAHVSDPDSLAPASGTNFFGFLMRDVVVGGPTFLERMTGMRNIPNADGTAGPAGAELPDVVGTNVACRMAEELEIDQDGGADFLLTSGTGSVDATGTGITPGVTEAALYTPAGGSKFRIKQTGDTAVGLFTAKGLEDAKGGTTGVRIKLY